MSIIRVAKNKDNPYLIMNKTVLEDKRLSLKAKGLCCYLLGKPDDWYVSTDEIVSNSTNCIKSIWSAINELVNYGYMYKHQFRKEDGKYYSYNYLIFENPGGTPLKKTTTSPNRPFGSSDKGSSDNGILLINKSNKLLKEAAFKSSNKSNTIVKSDAYLEKTNKTTFIEKILSDLNISNHKIFFDTFPISDIFQYSMWVKQRNCKMSNPTGFLYTAIKDKWMDNILLESKDPKSLLYYYRCSECGKVFGYPDQIPDYILCNKCEGSI
jgi:DNA-directed RNA polymerase subunit RPC12/RpoP